MQFKLTYLLLFLSLILSVNVTAQKTKRQQLEARRTQLQKDIVYISALLSNTERKEKNLLSEVKDLNDKIKKREDLINTISNESKELGNEISYTACFWIDCRRWRRTQSSWRVCSASFSK